MINDQAECFKAPLLSATLIIRNLLMHEKYTCTSDYQYIQYWTDDLFFPFCTIELNYLAGKLNTVNLLHYSWEEEKYVCPDKWFTN